MMTDPVVESAPNPQAIVVGDMDGNEALTGRAGASELHIGGPDGHGGTVAGANPYDLLSASLAACTAMTIRMYARRKKYPLSHVEVGVSFHRGGSDGRGSFERTITLEGDLYDQHRRQLMLVASMCPVARALGISADIHTREGDMRPVSSAGVPANYADDLNDLPIPYIDAD